MRKVILVVSILGLQGCSATTGTQSLVTSDTRECAKNFTYDGSFLAGRTFKTHDYVKGVTKSTGMKRAARYTVNDGWSITNTDNELGIISAAQTVSFGNGKTAPLNVSFEPVKGGVNMAMSFSISGGLTTPVEAVKDHFCATIAAVRK